MAMTERRRMTDNDHDRVVILESQMTEMRAAVEFALKSPFPKLESALENVWA